MMGMKWDRDLMEMAGRNLSVEQIAAKLKSTPKTVFRAGRRLGIYFTPLKPKPSGPRKTK